MTPFYSQFWYAQVYGIWRGVIDVVHLVDNLLSSVTYIWPLIFRELLLSIRFNEPGWEWSGCFLPEQLGDTQLKVRNYTNTGVSMMRVEVRSADVSVGEEKIVGSTSGNSGTNLILLSDDDTGFMPYRIDNHSREVS